MTHRKFHSQGSIPFSWEEKPGISKSCFQEYPTTDIDLHTLNLRPQNFLSEPKIPPPPCRPAQAPRRSSSAKGHQWQNDPFLVAYKECTTKSVKMGKFQSESEKGFGSKLRKSKFLFPCTSSCDVSDSFVKLSRLPPLPTRPFHVQNIWKLENRDENGM